MAAKRRVPSAVRASNFDPTQGPATFYNPAERYAQLDAGMSLNPGRAPMGSGSTGLMSGDARGYSQMLGEQQEYLKLQALINGTREPEIELGGTSTTARPYEPTFNPGFQGSAIVGIGNPHAQGPADTPALSGLSRAAKRKR